jgi:2-dehydropantoate 2-reductase
MNICVVGAGAVGGWIAASLARAGNPVMALTSRGPSGEITITQAGATETVSLTQFDGPADVLVIAVKAPALPAIAASLASLIGDETLVVPMLNGVPWWFVAGEPLRSVDPDGRISAPLPNDQLIGCVVHAACSRAAPDHVVVAHADKLILGEPAGDMSGRVDMLGALFEDAGISSERSADVRRAIWYKLWGNATVNPLCALTRATADRLLADPELRGVMLEAMAELAAVGSAIGCPIRERGEDRMAVTARLGAFKPSMLQDVEAGRQIELEALVGAPREIARRHGIATPALNRIYAMTHLMAESLGLL